jgi:serine/threonine protein kinase
MSTLRSLETPVKQLAVENRCTPDAAPSSSVAGRDALASPSSACERRISTALDFEVKEPDKTGSLVSDDDFVVPGSLKTKLLNLIGAGNFGKVYRALTSEAKLVAVKQISLPTSTEAQVKAAINEIQVRSGRPTPNL